MKYIKTFEIVYKPSENVMMKRLKAQIFNSSIKDFKVGDIVKIFSPNKQAKEFGVKKGELAEIVLFDKNDNIRPFKIMPLKYKIGPSENYWKKEFWVTRKQLVVPTDFELNMIKYNL